VFKGLSVLRHKLDEVRSDLISGADSKTVVEPVPNMDDFYHITVRDEDHTLGNLIQGMLYRRWVRDGMGREVAYVGYYQPHPLENNIAFKIKCVEPGDDVRKRFAEGVAWASAQLDELIHEWIAFSGLDKGDVVEVKELLMHKERKRTSAASVVASRS
jgi:DNA-directed RNA polymerase subunit L